MFVLLLWSGGESMRAQVTPAASVKAALRDLNERAGIAFAGEVVAVRHVRDVVEVQFQIDQVIKGAPGSSYVLREWAGLWAAGYPRYVKGERAMFFLQAPGANGLSSAVDGMEGILPMSVADGSSAAGVDLQRLRTRVVRDTRAPMADGNMQMSLDDVESVLHEDEPQKWRKPLHNLAPGKKSAMQSPRSTDRIVRLEEMYVAQ